MIVTNDGYRNHNYLLPLMRLALMRLALNPVFLVGNVPTSQQPTQYCTQYSVLSIALSIVLSTQHSVLLQVVVVCVVVFGLMSNWAHTTFTHAMGRNIPTCLP